MESDLKKIKSGVIIAAVLAGSLFLSYWANGTRPSRQILPGGITYLGRTPTPGHQTPSSASPTIQRFNDSTISSQIPIPPGAPWSTHTGKLHPYSFSYPSSLSLGFFPDDPYDSVTVFFEKTDANANIFFRVEDLIKLDKEVYRGKLEDYVRAWWKDYSWKGVGSMEPITNSNGLSGFRAAYTDASGSTPYDHVFLAVPDRDDLVIWISGKLFSEEVFSRIVSSVSWQ